MAQMIPVSAKYDIEQEHAEQDAFLPDYLLFLLASVSSLASAEFHAVVRENGLRVPEWRVLACLSDQDGQTITELATLSLMEQSRLTRIIDQMDGRALVARNADPSDRRRVRVFLTEHGRQLAGEMMEMALAHERKLLAAMPQGQGRQLKKVLGALYAQLGGRFP